MNQSGDEAGKKAIEQNAYTVVSFMKEKRKGKIVIELVPNLWLVQDKDEWLCFFPPKSMDAAKLIQDGKPPAPEWKRFPVEFIKNAATYEQGMRRLERAYREANVMSTEVESDLGAQPDKDANHSSDDVSSSTSPPRKKKKLPDSQNRTDSVAASGSSTDSEASTIASRGNKHTKHAEAAKKKVNYGSEKSTYLELKKRMDESDERMEKHFKSMAKKIKGAKQSILYDLNKQILAVKNTIVLNRGPGSGVNLKQHKVTLGVKLPITAFDAFVEFDAAIKDNEDKETALKEIMADMVGTSTQVKEAIRKILGSITMKAVQERYSGTGKKGPNGVTKNNFSATHIYSCMRDVIKDRIENADEKCILTATSRYLSGASDREGGKAARDANKTK